MNVVFDIKKADGEVLEGIHFTQYERPIRGGHGNLVLMYAPDSTVHCYKGEEELLGVSLDNSELIKAYDQDTGADVTEAYNFFIKAATNLQSPLSFGFRFPLAKLVRLES